MHLLPLDNCNCMIRYDDGSDPIHWFPAIERCGLFFDPSGKPIGNPVAHKWMTVDEINAYMKANSIEAVTMRLDAQDWDHLVKGSNMDINYPSIAEPVSEIESKMIEEIMIIGAQMRGADGLVAPFYIPPSVALAIVRKLCAMVS